MQLTHDPSCLHRLDFVFLSQKLIFSMPSELFMKFIRKPLLHLCKDKTANIRLALANMLMHVCTLSNKSQKHAKLALLKCSSETLTLGSAAEGVPISFDEVVDCLKQDEDREVNSIAHQVQIIITSENL